jgi:hypothetical protein
MSHTFRDCLHYQRAGGAATVEMGATAAKATLAEVASLADIKATSLWYF